MNNACLPRSLRLPTHVTPMTYDVDLITVWDDWVIDGWSQMKFRQGRLRHNLRT